MARILLADDDAATRDLVKRALAIDGHAVTSTQDGTEALDAITATPSGFDLLISDVQMPSLDGGRCYRIYRQSHRSERKRQLAQFRGARAARSHMRLDLPTHGGVHIAE
jgi:CheY-like chemotaxis protein